MGRGALSQAVRHEVLTEAGYRCAVPTCRTILAIDLHHIDKVSDGGSNTTDNLIALCPTCHALYHRGTIAQESIRVWKGMLVSLNQAFDKEAIDLLLFLSLEQRPRAFSSDSVLRFASLIVSGLVRSSFIISGEEAEHRIIEYSTRDHSLDLTERGRMVVDAWQSGNEKALDEALRKESGPKARSDP